MMKKLATLSLVLILAILACKCTPNIAPTPQIKAVENTRTMTAPILDPSPPPEEFFSPVPPTVTLPVPTTKYSSPVPTADFLYLPTPAYTISPYTPPADWIKVELGPAVIFLPPEMTMVDHEFEDIFAVQLPVAPGTDQVRRDLFGYYWDDSVCDMPAPDQAVTVIDKDGFEYVFYRGYVQEIMEGRTVEFLDYWNYENSEWGSYCLQFELILASPGTGTNGALESKFDLQTEIDFLETILSTFYLLRRG